MLNSTHLVAKQTLPESKVVERQFSDFLNLLTTGKISAVSPIMSKYLRSHCLPFEIENPLFYCSVG